MAKRESSRRLPQRGVAAKRSEGRMQQTRDATDSTIPEDVLVEKSKAPLLYFIPVATGAGPITLSTADGKSNTLVQLCRDEPGAVILIEKSKKDMVAEFQSSSGLTDDDIDRIAAALARKLKNPKA